MKRVALYIVLALTTLSATSQVVDGTKELGKVKKFAIEKGKSNWFLSAGANANIYVGQQDNQIKFLNRVGGGGSIFFGKWITPWIGFKIGVNAAQYKGAVLNGNTGNFTVKDGYWNPDETRHDISNLKEQRFFAFNPNIDIFFSLFNTIGRVKEKRVFDMVLSLGAGAFVNSGNKVDPESNSNGKYNTYSPTVNFGISNKFRLCESLDLSVDIKGGWVTNHFDGQTWNGEKFKEGDIITSLGITFIYKFKPRRTLVCEPIYYKDNTETQAYLEENKRLKEENDKVIEEIERIKNENSILLSENRKLNDSISIIKPVVSIDAKNEAGKTIAVIEFKIGSSVLNSTDRATLKNVANTIKENPKKTYEICGYADNATGSKELNIRLRNARANRTIDQLLMYGVNRNQIFKATNDGELPGTSTRAIIIREIDCE